MLLRRCLTIALCCCLANAGTLKKMAIRKERYVAPDDDSSGAQRDVKKSLIDTDDTELDDLKERYVAPDDDSSGAQRDVKKSLIDTDDTELDDLKERYVAPDDDSSGAQRDVKKSLIDTDDTELDDLGRFVLQSQANLDLDRRQSAGTFPAGIQTLGVGYNYLKGNPDGGRGHNGGVDPGIETTRKHFQFTYSDCLEAGAKEVGFAIRDSCVNETTTQIYHGTKSYQNKFSIDVSVAGSGSYGLADFAFSASAMYSEAKDETITTKNIVRDEQTVCNRGRLRIKTELEDVNVISVADGFAAAVCVLPSTYDKAKYMAFLNTWGTHTIVQVELGNKIIKRGQTSFKELFQFAVTEAGASISASGSYSGYSGSLSLDMSSLQQSESFSSNFASTLYTFTLGSDTEPQAIGLRLKPIPETLQNPYWSKLTDFVSRGVCPAGTVIQSINTKKTNVERALRDYPQHLAAEASIDLPYKIPLAWPVGTYSLPRPRDGCPTGWSSGSRHHDTEDDNSSNDYYNAQYLAGILHNSNDLDWQFCTKLSERSSEYTLNWPAGDYCIMRKGQCPTGFTGGNIKWDDEDDNNQNSASGIRPDGVYNHDTVIEFCCRKDGYYTNEIYLPRDKPFVLLRRGRNCQRVHGMLEYTAFIKWDDEDDNNISKHTGSTPYDDAGSDDTRLYFCYYN